MVARAQNFVCQNCGAASARWAGAATPAANGIRSPRKAPRRRRARRARAACSLSSRSRANPRNAAACLGLRRIRPGHRRRSGARLGAAAWRRPRHRQIHAVDRGGRRLRAPVTVRFIFRAKKPSRRFGCAPSGSALTKRRSSSRRRPRSRISSRRSRRGAPQLLVIDSIQTMWTQTVDAAPGTVTQVRGSAGELIRFAKRTGAAVILVGHVTKDGQIAGPRVVEHMVDAVLVVRRRRLAAIPHIARHQEPLRTDRRDRRVRDDRSRTAGSAEPFGAIPVRARSRQRRHRGLCRDRGHAAAAGGNSSARRANVPRHASPRCGRLGPDRLSMVLAVLEAHCGVRLSGHDVYLNVAGGLRITEPAADVAAAAALLSSLAHAPLPADAVYFGEVSLSGAVRPVGQTSARLKEAQKLGFAKRSCRKRPATRPPKASHSPPLARLPTSWSTSRRRHAGAAARGPSGQSTGFAHHPLHFYAAVNDKNRGC